MDQKKEITAQTHLTALALFTVARQHYLKLREMEFALHDLLGYDEKGYCGNLSDELYNDERGSFDEGMKREGFVIVDK